MIINDVNSLMRWKKEIPQWDVSAIVKGNWASENNQLVITRTNSKRAIANPFGVKVVTGKTYTFALTNSTYRMGLTFRSGDIMGISFDVPNADTSYPLPQFYNSGWITSGTFTYTVTDSNITCVVANFSRVNNGNMGSTDYANIKNAFSVTIS